MPSSMCKGRIGRILALGILLVVARISVGAGNDSSEARMRHDIVDFRQRDRRVAVITFCDAVERGFVNLRCGTRIGRTSQLRAPRTL